MLSSLIAPLERPFRFLLFLLSAAAPACLLPGQQTDQQSRMETEPETHPWYQRDHHKADGGFRNIWEPSRDVPFLKSAGWIIGRAFRQQKNIPPPVRTVEADTLSRPPERLRITWIGHSTVYVQTPDVNILIDPIFSKRASPISFAGPRREAALPLHVADLPGVDVVMISHDHYDHLDETSIEEIERRFKPLFLAPLGLQQILSDWGASRVIEMDWWQYVEVNGITYHCTPAKHFSGRGLTNRDGTLWAGWYVQMPENKVNLYYAGDTGYASLFSEIRERLGVPDVALLPIGAYLPKWFMQPIHVNPEEAMQAFMDVQASHFIPVHWGTFDLADDAIQEPAERIRQVADSLGLSENLHVLDIGGIFTLDPISKDTVLLDTPTW